jgi:phosphoribosylaminoimidazole-succinocarboxamide synthase
LTRGLRGVTPMVLIQTDLSGLKFHSRGKVRDIYDLGSSLLFIATDRLSAFDVVLPTAIPNKGRVLTQMSLFWFDYFKDVLPNHVITDKVEEYPEEVRDFKEQLEGRSLLVRPAEVFPIECVVRGYLAGSGWKDYKQSGAICGIGLGSGLSESDRLSEPIFTPATKAATGHDENISEETAADIVGRDTINKLRDLSIDIYNRAAAYARERGIIICDTKFEFGLVDGNITIVDEMLTPDSSRFWPAAEYSPGRAQPSFDKQFVRDYLESISWDKQPPAPELPPDVAEATGSKYIEAFHLLTGLKFE